MNTQNLTMTNFITNEQIKYLNDAVFAIASIESINNGQIVENRPWVAIKNKFEQLTPNSKLVLLLENASDFNGIEWAAQIDNIIITNKTTTIQFSNLIRLDKPFKKGNLIKSNNQEKLAPNYRRSYVPCQLPKSIAQELQSLQSKVLPKYFLMTWNPSKWPYKDLMKFIQEFDKTGISKINWLIAAHTQVKIGDQAIFFKQGKGLRGIFGRGTVVGNPWADPSSLNKNGDPQYRVEVRFDELYDPNPEPIIPFDLLFESTIWNSQSSGISIPEQQAKSIDSLWKEISPSFYSKHHELIKNENQNQQFSERTTRLAYLLTRTTQTKFRNKLIKKWGKCMVTGFMNPKVLVASHIVPWSLANKFERQDVFNGLLLVAHLDKLFDAYLISFDKTGNILISQKLSIEDQKILGVSNSMRLTNIPFELEKYMVKHRKKFKEEALISN
jgi:hypothetical protein